MGKITMENYTCPIIGSQRMLVTGSSLDNTCICHHGEAIVQRYYCNGCCTLIIVHGSCFIDIFLLFMAIRENKLLDVSS